MWSAIYLPLTISGWIIEGGLDPTYLILCLRNFVFVGENFYSWTLWYLNGLVFALLLIDILLKDFQLNKFPALVCYIFGRNRTDYAKWPFRKFTSIFGKTY